MKKGGITEEKGSRAVIFRVLSYLKPFKKEFLLAGILLALATAIGFLQPLLIRQITDRGMLAQDLPVLYRAVALLALLVALNQAVEMAQTRLFVQVHNRSLYGIFRQVFQKLLRLKKPYFEDKNNAEILSFLQMDVSQVASITDRYTVMSVSYVFRIVSGLAGLLVISWKLTLIVLAMVPLKVLLVRRFSKRQEKAMDKMIESSRDFSQWFGDNIEGIDEIKLWNLFESREKAFQSRQRDLLALQKGNAMIDAWNTLWESLLEWSVTLLLYLAGGFLICRGGLTVGSVFAFVSYSWYVTGPVSALLNLKMYFARILPSARRLFRFLDMEPEPDTGTGRVGNRPPRLAFQDVSFAYQADRPILQGACFHVEPGEKVAIIGQNGSGKSTVLNLLLRFYTPEAGEITADHVPVSRLALAGYRSLFSVVSQEPYLFLGDIAGNIDLTGQASPEEVAAAMDTSGVAAYLQHMPQGEKTQVGRNGARLSGGEKQKLAVARALLKDAPVVILDEATAGFDVESDAYLHDVIVNQMAGKSVIMITHHYEHLEGMDRVYRLEGGRLYEERREDGRAWGASGAGEPSGQP
ncbi:ABC transporter ATP-binding protein [Acutalibacter caecimuris]|uniref:ABC transporter ATP-binding protein n=1 Tax=Acutalibacter caecimuris TaxID=3093657 RepID=UPI002AC99DC2|nr:ABC transporter ATP-binding protein [Acutalibacter sp. M00118]